MTSNQIHNGIGNNNNQTHTGSGDNNIYHIYHNSLDYKNLERQIQQYEKLVKALYDTDNYELLQSTTKELAILKEQEQQFKDTVFRLYETFTTIAINTDRLRKAKEHFDNGRFREADAVLQATELMKA